MLQHLEIVCWDFKHINLLRQIQNYQQLFQMVQIYVLKIVQLTVNYPRRCKIRMQFCKLIYYLVSGLDRTNEFQVK